jgi:hypothetical protein
MMIDLGIFISVAVAVVAAWWTIAVIAIKQFERRQEDRFAAQNKLFDALKDELDSHMTRQDSTLTEIRRVEGAAMAEIRRVEVDSLQRFQTKTESNTQHQQVITEIRALGSRIDALHGRISGMAV